MPEAREWRFDLDGTLVASQASSALRPHAVELLSHLRASGCPVLVWSAGGADYAARVVDQVGIGSLVDGVLGKERGADGRLVLHGVVPATLVCVDDDPTGLPLGVEVVGVFPYIGVNPHDGGLRRVLDRLVGSASSENLHA